MDNKSIQPNIDKLLNNLEKTGKKYNIDKITRAFEYARTLHEGQFRQNGEAYISHPIAVAEIAAEMELDTDSICAALLHDIVEDCSDKTNLKDIEKKFGRDVATIVDGLTKLVSLQVEDKEEAHIENLRKMLFAMAKDIRVILIKLCDRIHNMRTLDAKPEEKRRLIALETMQVYAPLAHRLGMQRVKQELEDRGLYYLDPIGYTEVKNDIEKKYGQNRNLLDTLSRHIAEKLTENQIKFTLEGRVKSVYSIYRKMYTQNKSFDEIYDFYAIRIIVENELECYTALGIIHEMFSSVPGRFKDYISTPKPNMYRSLHTTVIGREGIPFEVQIRTYEMHQIAEYGIAAHWKYKTGEQSKEEIDKRLEWIARLIETEDVAGDPEEFLQAIKTDIFQEETYVFTPKGDLIALPAGATVIDFAYAIHSEVGNKMVGAKINGMIVPIDRVLQNGEIVEILTSSSSKGPSRDWLKIVKTSEARSKIRQWFKKEKRAENIVVGKAAVDAELKKLNRPYTEAQKNEIVQNVSQRVGFNTPDDLYNALGYGGIAITRIAGKLRDEFERIVGPEPEKPAAIAAGIEQVQISEKPKNIKSNTGIIVDGQTGCMVKFAKCCNPLPGDEVIGFITKGFGISIHKINCPNVIEGKKKTADASRWVSARWDSDTAENPEGGYEAIMQLYIVDRLGIIADISRVLAEIKVPILSINSQKRGSRKAIINMKISCRNITHYDMIVDRLRSIHDVEDVVRGFI
ncbi:MAG: bifunctional (p)ppGpp synthetase/guanosine-3',5'-bis(diphosphate) 3'-pyrophosphohydrolase [Clostridiales bacterium]|nr:bifunctional (p)ppGpp synthetase/guanosine-3',5'-bis(diphosphate) 3'-pyrophosphohydrolase [Clostridiales bacterium]